MMKSNAYATSAITALLGVLLMTGCATKSPRVDYYTLGVATVAGEQTAAEGSCSQTPVAIGPVSWPRYLDQPRIVTRTGPHTLEFDEFHRWAGSLRDSFERVLRKDLAVLLQSDYLVSYGGAARLRTAYRVELDIEQFDGALGGDVILDVKWAILDQKTGKLHGRLQSSTIRQATNDQDHAALVHAASMAVAQLAGEIAAELARVCATLQP